MVTKWQTGQLKFNNMHGRGDRVGQGQTKPLSSIGLSFAE